MPHDTDYLNASETLAKARHDDFDDVTSGYESAMKQDNKLRAEILGAPDPAEALYQHYREEQAPKIQSMDEILK